MRVIRQRRCKIKLIKRGEGKPPKKLMDAMGVIMGKIDEFLEGGPSEREAEDLVWSLALSVGLRMLEDIPEENLDEAMDKYKKRLLETLREAREHSAEEQKVSEQNDDFKVSADVAGMEDAAEKQVEREAAYSKISALRVELRELEEKWNVEYMGAEKLQAEKLQEERDNLLTELKNLQESTRLELNHLREENNRLSRMAMASEEIKKRDGLPEIHWKDVLDINKKRAQTT